MKVQIAVMFTLCIASTLGGLTDEQKAKLKATNEFCIAESGVDPVVARNAVAGQFVENDEKLGCFSKCLLQRIGVVNAENKVNHTVIRSKVPPGIPKEDVDAAINRCEALQGDSSCSASAKVLECFLQTQAFRLL